MIQPLWRTVWRFLKKLGIKPSYDPAIPLIGTYSEESKIYKELNSIKTNNLHIKNGQKI